MTERPILFSGPMVRAILDGSKTQTRRPLRIQPPSDTGQYRYVESRKSWFHESMTWRLGDVFPGSQNPDQSVAWVAAHGTRCPFGVPGDRLWVRETWRPFSYGAHVVPNYAADQGAPGTRRELVPPADWKVPAASHRGMVPAIHMPRWASRITLEVLDVRVERLQDISEEDARAEGWPGPRADIADPEVHRDAARDWFMDLWSATYGAESWAANSWTWAVTFKRV